MVICCDCVGFLCCGKGLVLCDYRCGYVYSYWYVLERKDKISAFSYDIVSLVQAGDIAAAHWYVGATLYTLEEPDKLGFVIPEEGATMYQEDICVLKDAPNKDSAISFFEFYMQPEIAALNTLQQVNGTANMPARALLPDNL